MDIAGFIHKLNRTEDFIAKRVAALSSLFNDLEQGLPRVWNLLTFR